MTSPRTALEVMPRLCELSRKEYVNPYAILAWPETLPSDAWCMSPELISLHGTEEYEALDEAARRRLAFYEAVNFFSLNINGERALCAGLARRLYSPELGDLSAYLHHFLDEENKHMIYFGTFCQKYAGKTYPDKKVVVDREYAEGEAELTFFLRVMIFEEIVDVYNVRMGRDMRLHPVAREINRMHHRDEARHLVFGRRLVRDLWDRYASRWSASVVETVRRDTEAYLEATWREYYNPDVYRDAGLPDAYGLTRRTWASERARRHRDEVSAPCLSHLIDTGILPAERSA